MPDLVYDDNDTALKLQAQAITTGSSVTLSGEQTIDGVSIVSGDRVVIKDQANAENGIWVADAGAWIRADDFTGEQLDRRTSVFIKQGTNYAGTTWEITDSSTAVIGFDTLTFSLRSSPITAIGTEETDPDGTEQFHIEDGGTDKFITISNADEGMIISSTSGPTVNDDEAGTAGNGEMHRGRRWINTVTNSAFISVDSSTGGAVWNEIPYNTYAKTAAPTTNDDLAGTAGTVYTVGSVWIDTTDNIEWVCVDDTATAAIWNRRVYDFTTTTDPTVNDDDANTSGNGVFQAGSKWTNTSSGEVFVLTDATATAAVWLNLEPHRRRTLTKIITDTTLTSTQRYVVCDATTASANPTLPVGSSAEDYIISCIDATNGVSVIPSSNQTIGVLDSTSWPLSKGETIHLYHDYTSTSPSVSGRWEVM